MRTLLSFVGAIVASVVVSSLFVSREASAQDGTLTLFGKVEGQAVPNGKAELAFNFFDKDTKALVYRTLATAVVEDGMYTASVNAEDLTEGKEYYVLASSPSEVPEVQEAQGQPLGIVLLQPTTPGMQQVGHANINGRLIAGQFQGDGSLLTNLNASNITSGVLPDFRLFGQYSRQLNFSNPGNVFVGDGSGLTGITASGLLLPFAGTTGSSGVAFRVTSTATTVNSGAITGVGPTSGVTFGVSGISASTQGFAVAGFATATTGITYGGYFEDASSTGFGTYGLATSATGAGTGGYFESRSPNGFGVRGVASANSGANAGVSGVSNSPNGYGVYGLSNANAGYGGLFETAGPGGRAVGGVASATTGPNVGVYGSTNSPSGYGVYGISSATTGVAGFFEVPGTGATALSGFASATSGNTTGVLGRSSSPDGKGVYGVATATTGVNSGVFGQSSSGTGYGVRGLSMTGGSGVGGFFEATGTEGKGVYGYASSPGGFNSGVYGETASENGHGVFGIVSATAGINMGVRGQSASTAGFGVYGYASATTGTTYGGYFQSKSSSGRGAVGLADSASGTTYGGYFDSRSTSGTGVYGVATATTGTTYGGYLESRSESGTGVYGVATATTGTTYGGYFLSKSSGGRGVVGLADSTGGPTYGGYFESRSDRGTGVYGLAASGSGTTYGVYGRSLSSDGIGVYGHANDYGLYGEASSSLDGTGVYGSGDAYGLYAYSRSGYGVYGKSDSPRFNNKAGVYGTGIEFGGIFEATGENGVGVQGRATNTVSGYQYGVKGYVDGPGNGVLGWALASSGTPSIGVRGQSSSTEGTGVVGWAMADSGSCIGVHGDTDSPDATSYGVYGEEPTGGAGHAIYAYGTLAATGVKSFQIDHPLDPENFYLNHFCTEGPEPYNTYRGNVRTNEKGYATINLPPYFENINTDPTYNLTVIDDSDDFVLAKVVRKIQNNQFVIRTNKPYVEVSWEVKAIRNDRYVQRYGFETEQEKEDKIKGKYLHPELFGMPQEYGIHYRPDIERRGETLGRR